MQRYTIVSGSFLALVALAQLTRGILGWPATVGGVTIPVWCSIVAAIITGSLAIWAVRLSRVTE